MLHSPALLELGGGELLDLRNPPAGSHFGFKEHFAPCRAVRSVIISNNLCEFILINQQCSDKLCHRVFEHL